MGSKPGIADIKGMVLRILGEEPYLRSGLPESEIRKWLGDLYHIGAKYDAVIPLCLKMLEAEGDITRVGRRSIGTKDFHWHGELVYKEPHFNLKLTHQGAQKLGLVP